MTARLDLSGVSFEVDDWDHVTAVRVTLYGGAAAADAMFLVDGQPVRCAPDFWAYVGQRTDRLAAASG